MTADLTNYLLFGVFLAVGELLVMRYDDDFKDVDYDDAVWVVALTIPFWPMWLLIVTYRIVTGDRSWP